MAHSTTAEMPFDSEDEQFYSPWRQQARKLLEVLGFIVFAFAPFQFIPAVAGSLFLTYHELRLSIWSK